jgi:transglutaminase-like putative cysteine protease
MFPKMTGRAVLLVILLFAHSLASAERPYEPQVTLERDVTNFAVNADGSYRETVERVLRIETPQGAVNEGAQRLRYVSSQEDIESIEAWTVQPDGTRISVPPESIRSQDEGTEGGASEFTDEKSKAIIFPQVQVGSRLYLKATTFTHTPRYAGEFTMNYVLVPRWKREHWEVNITLPAGTVLYIEKRGVNGGLEATADGLDHYNFRYRNDEAIPSDETSVAAFDYADVLRASTLADATAIGKIYQSSARDRVTATERVRALAISLTAGLTDERAKAKALYLWVSKNIRYVAVTLGNGAVIPHRADEVLTNLYGDCKDHVVLLEALLAAVGIDSSPALINFGRAYTVAAVGVLSPFNHVITYVPSLDLYLDSTAQFAPMGSLPFEDLDKPVILTALGRLGRTPALRADANVMQTIVAMDIRRDGTIEGTSLSTMSGIAETQSRSIRFDERAEPEEQVVKGLLSRFNETGSGSIRHTDPEDLEATYWVNAEFQLDPVANIPGLGAMMVPVGLAPGAIAALAADKPSATMRHAYPCVSRSVEESYTLRFPPNVSVTQVPVGVRYRDSNIAYDSSYERAGRVVSVKRRLVVQHDSQVCRATDSAQWRAFYVVVQRDLRSQVFYR